MSTPDLDGQATASKLLTPENSSEPPLSWEPLVLTESKIYDLWEKMNQFELVWDDFSKGDFNGFVERLLRPDAIYIDIGPGVGLASGTGIRPKLDMVLHLVMFDKRLRGREPLLKEIIAHFFDKLQLRRVTCIIGEDAKTALKLVSRLGFVHEGTMRHAFLRGGVYLNAEVFGLLREELEWQP